MTFKIIVNEGICLSCRSALSDGKATKLHSDISEGYFSFLLSSMCVLVGFLWVLYTWKGRPQEQYHLLKLFYGSKIMLGMRLQMFTGGMLFVCQTSILLYSLFRLDFLLYHLICGAPSHFPHPKFSMMMWVSVHNRYNIMAQAMLLLMVAPQTSADTSMSSTVLESRELITGELQLQDIIPFLIFLCI